MEAREVSLYRHCMPTLGTEQVCRGKVDKQRHDLMEDYPKQKEHLTGRLEFSH